MQDTETNPLAERIRAEIEADGPIPFSRFMSLALYDESEGYYRSGDPFGIHGDFYTAEQIQPVFGRIAAQWMASLKAQLGMPDDFTVVEMGAGRAEMAESLSEFLYIPVELGRREAPREFCGVVFANEFFDALPVEVVRLIDGTWVRMRVGLGARKDTAAEFEWIAGEPADTALLEYVERNCPPGGEVRQLEVCPSAARWVDELARRMTRGFFVFVDYGYQRRELVRFPEGTLMSYSRHRASGEVLVDAGRRDITAHVNFSELRERCTQSGLEVMAEGSLASAVMRIGESDNFESVLRAENEAGRLHLRMQLKTLLFGMGETFRTLVAYKRG